MSTNETRPTIETVLERINTLQTSIDARFERVDTEVAQMRSEITQMRTEVTNLREDVKTGFRKVERKMGMLSHDFLDRRADYDELAERVEKLESK